MRKRMIAILMLLIFVLGGCKGNTSDGNNASGDGTVSTDDVNAAELTMLLDTADMFTNRDYEVGYDESESTAIVLKGSTAESSSDAVEVSGSTVTITEEGTYILSGTLKGMIVVNAAKTDKLQLVLDGVSIESESSAAIYILQADKVFLTLAPDSANTLKNGGTFTAIDDNNIDAVIFSKEDLTLNGQGSLTIESPAGHGVVSKDDLVVTSGTYAITAASHGLSGKDSVRIAGGTFDITAGKDGIHAENSDDATLGFVYILNGTFQFTAEGDGVSAASNLQVDGGSFTLVTGAKGLKAGTALLVNAGSFHIDSADDALHSNGSLTVNGGTFEMATGDDGMHADEQLAITGGTINITKSYEGIEGLTITISGGEITLVSSDDGLNAAGGNDQSGFGGFGGNGEFGGSSDCWIRITGGLLNINASGDGIDSNGMLYVDGGEIYVSGPSDNGNGALDYNSDAVITGGILVAAGASGMAQNFGTSSTQGSMLVSTGSQSAGSTITLTDSNGNELLSFQAAKAFDCVVISCPGIVQGATYTVSAGGSSTEVTMDSLIYGSGGMGGGMNGNPGGMNGGPGGMNGGPGGTNGGSGRTNGGPGGRGERP